MASVKIIEKDSGGVTLNTYVVDCDSVTFGWNNTLEAAPKANCITQGISEVQKQVYENPIYSLKNVLITGRSGTLSYEDLVRITKLPTSTDDNYLLLDIDYSDIQSYGANASVEIDFATYTTAQIVTIADNITFDEFTIRIGSDVAGNGAGDTVDYRVTFTYDDATTEQVTGNVDATGSPISESVTNPEPTKVVSTVEVELKYTFGSGGDFIPTYYGYSYTPNNTKKLIDSAEASNGIKVVVKSFNLSVGLDKRFATTNRVIVGSITLQESA